MKTILIPTDFNETSVYLTEDILKNFKSEPVKIIFFHAYKLTDSISDLLMLSRRSTEYGQIPESFHKACYDFKKKYAEKVSAVGIEYFYGSTMAAFRNFAEANEVDFIYCPVTYSFRPISKYSINPDVFLNKSGIPVIDVVQDEPSVKTNKKIALEQETAQLV
ncbi:hypothetical protein HDF26_003328 [Pedobacter cryoconitis]|uniref:Universal stress protein n=1 Tax=Pedobacter cryoconitis TaxID=188932 RepID=A0A7W8ZLH7_9SPHI|nr:hypothetical protein [Pedobacter cryoconitis]MBB5636214.1 hypothetical protein [Pedobacter cryoconitis]MBB6272868.1 hypothetical protein [Pedobacter cryoconitis]